MHVPHPHPEPPSPLRPYPLPLEARGPAILTALLVGSWEHPWNAAHTLTLLPAGIWAGCQSYGPRAASIQRG